MLKDLCIPIPGFGEDEIAELHLKVGDRKISYDFRVESFPWDVDDELNGNADEITRSLARISRLRKAIENYDKNWQLIQIFTPAENSNYIQVLYRKKKD
ncbi:MAG: hypothetical protein V2I54_04890 [Bacteroidales bacterium]|jgi:hypothetical protein|nr:hypothetical protein [Bacteroidales bacterium]